MTGRPTATHLLVQELPGILLNVALIQVCGQAHEAYLGQPKVSQFDVTHGCYQEAGDDETNPAQAFTYPMLCPVCYTPPPAGAQLCSAGRTSNQQLCPAPIQGGSCQIMTCSESAQGQPSRRSPPTHQCRGRSSLVGGQQRGGAGPAPQKLLTCLA